MKPYAIVDFPLLADSRNPLVFSSPHQILVAESIDQVRDVIREAERCAHRGAWVAGFVSYDAAPAFDAVFRTRRDEFPLAWFGVFDAPHPLEADAAASDVSVFSGWEANIGRERFEEDIAAIRQAIHDGDVYQVNHTLRLKGSYTGSDLALFRRLKRAQPDSYAAYLNIGQWRILSVSPELFFRRDADILTAKPMKGTAKRGLYPEEDQQIAAQLQSSEKDRAENLMIVDLLRNDLSRIAIPHTLQVPELFSIERHPTVFQMTSTITAQARPGTALDEIFAALFPCGSVTGAPKLKAMEIIAEREQEPRGIYCGAIGLLRPGGDAVFNVAIRTVTLNDAHSTATCGVGGGIVWDSTAAEEYNEVILKSHFLNSENEADFCLLETLRLEDGRYQRLDYHLARLASSARYFGRPFDVALCRRKLEGLAGNAGSSSKRIRIKLDTTGAMDIDVSALPQPVLAPAKFAIADTPVSRNNVWLFHKTTNREVFERVASSAPDVFDVLLWNDQGELTEFTRGNLVMNLGGRNLTPPVGCGLLDGCLRRQLLDEGQITEERLTLDDLSRARHIWFINSLRGRIEVFQQ